MTYMVKHSINAITPKFAVVYKATNYTLSSGLPFSATLQFDSLEQSTGMGLSLSSNAVVLERKNYIVYFKSSFSNSSEQRGATVSLSLNGSTVSSADRMDALFSSNTLLATAPYSSPMPYAYAYISASAGDLLTVVYTRTAGSGFSDTFNSIQCKIFVVECGS
jgi:hypothetical protein